MKQVKDRGNKTSDSAWYSSLRTDEKINALSRNPSSAFHPEIYKRIQKYLPDLRGKKVLLPSSGDNHAAFAFAIWGAEVTSTDISERQLENAKKIADKLGLHIRFVCDDTMHLTHMDTGYFDLVQQNEDTLADINDWHKNPMAALPAWLSITAQK